MPVGNICNKNTCKYKILASTNVGIISFIGESRHYIKHRVTPGSMLTNVNIVSTGIRLMQKLADIVETTYCLFIFKLHIHFPL